MLVRLLGCSRPEWNLTGAKLANYRLSLSPVHRRQNVPLDVLLVRAAVVPIRNADVGMAEEVLDEGQVLRAPVELGRDAMSEEMSIEAATALLPEVPDRFLRRISGHPPSDDVFALPKCHEEPRARIRSLVEIAADSFERPVGDVDGPLALALADDPGSCCRRIDRVAGRRLP